MSTIQFIAHHSIQAEVFMGVASLLDNHKCIISIGQDIAINAEAEVVVMADHAAFQKNLASNSKYHLVHFSHDIVDVDIYKEEKEVLKHFSLILCPSKQHLKMARMHLPRVPSYFVGWQKIFRANKNFSPEFDRQNTVIFAPTEIADLKWEPIIEGLLAANYKVLIKNHIYWDFESGAPAPRGQESRYQLHRTQLKNLEIYVSSLNSKNLILVDRKSDITELFSKASILITDNSSVALEFSSFGISIELGILDHLSGKRLPDVSTISEKVIFMKEFELLDNLKNTKWNFSSKVSENIEDSCNEKHTYSSLVEPDQISAYFIDQLSTLGKKKRNLYIILKSLVLNKRELHFRLRFKQWALSGSNRRPTD